MLLLVVSGEGSSSAPPAAEVSSVAAAGSPDDAASASAPASARSQRGNPPENRRGTPLPLGAGAGRLPVARGGTSLTTACSPGGLCSRLGAGGGAPAGFPP